MFQDIEVLHDSLPSNTTLTISYALEEGSFTTLGTANNTAATKSFIVPFLISITGKKFQYKIAFATTDISATPSVKDIVVRYILVSHLKQQWNFKLIPMKQERLYLPAHGYFIRDLLLPGEKARQRCSRISMESGM